MAISIRISHRPVRFGTAVEEHWMDFLPIIPLALGIPLRWPYNSHGTAIVAGEAFSWGGGCYGAISSAHGIKTGRGKLRQTLGICYDRMDDDLEPDGKKGYRVDLESATGFFHALNHFITKMERVPRMDGFSMHSHSFRQMHIDIWKTALDEHSFNLITDDGKKEESLHHKGLRLLKVAAFRRASFDARHPTQYDHQYDEDGSLRSYKERLAIWPQAMLLARLIQAVHNLEEDLAAICAESYRNTEEGEAVSFQRWCEDNGRLHQGCADYAEFERNAKDYEQYRAEVK
jgi:hypothetical protein